MRALQFIGTQRSGSNLLRVMLNGHSAVSAPHPPHILQVMMPLLPMYGSLENPDSFKRLVNDVCTLVEFNPVSWAVQLDREHIASRCTNFSLPQIMKAVYEVKALSTKAEMWCCKSMASVHYVEELEAADLHPIYIFIFRDGRDVACSFRKAVVGEKHIFNLATQWKSEQDLSLEICERFGTERSIMIRYEDLISDPEKELRRICLSLSISYESAMLDYAQTEESRVTASSGKMWGNLVKPVMKDNTRKFLKELSHEDLIIFESIAGHTLGRLGYDAVVDAKDLRSFEVSEIEKFNALNQQWKKDAQASAPDDMNKRKLQDDFIQTLKKQYHDFTIANEAYK